jgi:hypothetical protein
MKHRLLGHDTVNPAILVLPILQIVDSAVDATYKFFFLYGIKMLAIITSQSTSGVTDVQTDSHAHGSILITKLQLIKHFHFTVTLNPVQSLDIKDIHKL